MMLFPISVQTAVPASPVAVPVFLQQMPSLTDLVEAFRTDPEKAPRFIETANRCLAEYSRLSIKSQRWCLESLVKEADVWAATHQDNPPDALDLGKLEVIATANGSKKASLLERTIITRNGASFTVSFRKGLHIPRSVLGMGYPDPLWASPDVSPKVLRQIRSGYYDAPAPEKSTKGTNAHENR